MVVQCCVCKRVRHEDAWEHAADPDRVAMSASHGYCPSCLNRAYAEFSAQKRSPLVAASSAA